MDLQNLERMCERLYNASDPGERSAAEQALLCFSTNTDYISHCQQILDESQSPYAQLLASSSLVKLVTDNALSAQLRLDIRTYVLNYLANKGPSLAPFVKTALVQLIARLTKLGWFENEQHREIIKEVTQFLQASPTHKLIGFRIINQLVAEMNQPSPGRSLTSHRKIAVSFRDQALFQIFQISLTSLKQLLNDPSAQEEIMEQVLSLALKCLSFDFVGTSLDESTEDLGTIQIPSSWRPLLEDPSTIQLFFDFYGKTRPSLSSTALECLTRLASVRRSLFSGEPQRGAFLAQLINGTREVLRTQKGLNEHANYHEYCRLLGRLKTNYQLSELVNVHNYGEWIQLVAEFTIQSLQSWQWAKGSVYYLLGLWSRLVSSMPYLKGDTPSLLDNYVPKITQAFITSRLDSVGAVLQNSLTEDPLENEEQLQDQLDSIPFLCRFQYDKSSAYLMMLGEPILKAYMNYANNSAQPGAPPIEILEGQLTWLVYIHGAIIRGRLSSSAAESQEVIDGELASTVFQLVQVTDNAMHQGRYGETSKQRLDCAILSFFQNFRKVYIGEQAMHSSKVYKSLAERLGLHDHLMVLNLMVSKIATNLKCFKSCTEVVESTLSLFQDLAAGYMSGKLLLKLDAINWILAHHTRDYFPFLDEYSNMCSRTTFYNTLGRLLFMEDSAQKFKAFMMPIHTNLNMLAASTPQQFQTDAARISLIGNLRDLRGIAMATSSRRTYGLLFEWMYPTHTPMLLRAVEVWGDRPEVTTPLLKFLAEFVLNKTQRLTFESSSPNGILLFREVSKLLVAYGQKVLNSPVQGDPYAFKYKGIWIALTALTRALSGSYVNFGVFDLYGDRALADALNMALKMALSVPLADILAYRKVAKAYFALLECLCHSHISFILSQDTPTFTHIVQSIEAGLKSLEVSISSQCASAIDNLVAYHFTHTVSATIDTPPPPPAQALSRHMAERPNLFPDILKLLFEIVLFEDCANQWSLSRPMLSLILVNEQIFNDLKQQIVSTQPIDRQQVSITVSCVPGWCLSSKLPCWCAALGRMLW